MSDTPQDEVPEPKPAEWLPPAAKRAAEKIYRRKLNEGTSDDIELLNRLTSDERMKKVWRELKSKRYAISTSTKRFSDRMLFYFNCLAQTKRKKAKELRQKGGDFNKATAQLLEGEANRLDRPPSEAPDSWPEQDCAIYCFFYGAYHIARDLQLLLSREELKTIHDKYVDVSKQLRDLLRSFGMDYYADQLGPIALEVEERHRYVEIDYEDNGMRVVDRRRSDRRVQSYVVQLAMITRVIFGDSLSGTLAATANVALNLEKPYVGTRVGDILDHFPYTGMGGENAIPWD
jgi:hypothetical protein